ncbi:MAG: class I SAM-dependent methyltransferase [Firmicutes bacterium]|nr:class I SAM-dependent methyltransferase [Bacillota bacterium]MCL5039881.1 class I SAM-dependent methyltransferase [Bacillota bacterium]
MSLLQLPNEDELNAVEGWLGLEEGRRLAYLASTVPGHLAIVELGSWKGRSTAWLGFGSKLGRRAPVYAVDHWKGSSEHQFLFTEPDCSTYPEFKANMDWLGLNDIVTPITGKTVEIGKSWRQPIGLLFIDAAHEYEAVKADFLTWSPFLVEGGWVVFHDAGFTGPHLVIQEYIEHSSNWGGFNPYPPFSAQKLRG